MLLAMLRFAFGPAVVHLCRCYSYSFCVVCLIIENNVFLTEAYCHVKYHSICHRRRLLKGNPREEGPMNPKYRVPFVAIGSSN
jgi:hypothetical protein